MITGNRDTVEFGHISGGIFENITDDAHGSCRRIDIGITNHEFFQNVVLDRTCHNWFVYALFFTSQDIEGQYRQHCAVHCHWYRHLIQRNAGEKNLHIQNGVNGNTGFTYVTDNARMIGVITAVSCKVKCDRQTFLPCRQVTAIESIWFFCSREACILTYCPGFGYIHRWIRPTQKWRDTCHIMQMFAVFIGIHII